MIGWRFAYFEDLPSSSDHCIAAAQAGEPAGLAVQALRQSAGRGSRGRAWRAPEGNLNLSVLLRPGCLAADAGCFALLAGVAVAEALGPGLTLKWPNDILLNGAKLGGVLIDAAVQGERLDWLVIGMGVNLAEAPQVPGRETACLAASGRVITPRAAADAVLAAMARWLDRPVAEVIEAWLAYAHPVGTKVTVQAGGVTQAGLFAGLSPSGELLLETPEEVRRISTGEVLLSQT